MIGYKLLRLRKNNTLGPLFINRKQIIPLGITLQAESHRTPKFKYRPGWHITNSPIAPHLSKKNRVWAKVEFHDFIGLHRPASQGGLWFLAQKMKLISILSDYEVNQWQS